MTKAILIGAALTLTVTAAASAPTMPAIDQLRGCLSIDNMTKERLNCYDAIVPPEPITVAPKAKTVLECRFLREEDERLVCFNGFLSGRASVDPAVTPKTWTHTAPTTHRDAPEHPSAEKRPNNLKLEINVVSKMHPITVTTGHAGGCGSRGGPGYRLSNGKCAS